MDGIGVVLKGIKAKQVEREEGSVTENSPEADTKEMRCF